MLKPSGNNLKHVCHVWNTLSNSAEGILLLSMVTSLQQTSFTLKLIEKLDKQQKITRGRYQRGTKIAKVAGRGTSSGDPAPLHLRINNQY